MCNRGRKELQCTDNHHPSKNSQPSKEREREREDYSVTRYIITKGTKIRFLFIPYLVFSFQTSNCLLNQLQLCLLKLGVENTRALWRPFSVQHCTMKKKISATSFLLLLIWSFLFKKKSETNDSSKEVFGFFRGDFVSTVTSLETSFRTEKPGYGFFVNPNLTSINVHDFISFFLQGELLTFIKPLHCILH